MNGHSIKFTEHIFKKYPNVSDGKTIKLSCMVHKIYNARHIKVMILTIMFICLAS